MSGARSTATRRCKRHSPRSLAGPRESVVGAFAGPACASGGHGRVRRPTVAEERCRVVGGIRRASQGDHRDADVRDHGVGAARPAWRARNVQFRRRRQRLALLDPALAGTDAPRPRRSAARDPRSLAEPGLRRAAVPLHAPRRRPELPVDYWTNRQFAPEVIASMNEVVKTLRRRIESPRVRW